MKIKEELESIKHEILTKAIIEKEYSIDYLINNADRFNSSIWLTICGYQKLTEEFIERFRSNVCWSKVSQNQKLSTEFIQKHIDQIDLHNLGPHNQLPVNFIKENTHKLQLFYLLASRKWSHNEAEILLKSFKKQGFYIHSREERTKDWMLEKIETFKENTVFKNKKGGQLELPFIYPHYKNDTNLRDLYAKRVCHNLDILKNRIENGRS